MDQEATTLSFNPFLRFVVEFITSQKQMPSPAVLSGVVAG